MHANFPLFSKSFLIQGWKQEPGALILVEEEVQSFKQEKPPLPHTLEAGTFVMRTHLCSLQGGERLLRGASPICVSSGRNLLAAGLSGVWQWACLLASQGCPDKAHASMPKPQTFVLSQSGGLTPSAARPLPSRGRGEGRCGGLLLASSSFRCLHPCLFPGLWPSLWAVTRPSSLVCICLFLKGPQSWG